MISGFDFAPHSRGNIRREVRTSGEPHHWSRKTGHSDEIEGQGIWIGDVVRKHYRRMADSLILGKTSITASGPSEARAVRQNKSPSQTFSAVSGMRLLACLIVAPRQSYDEPGFLSYAIRSFYPTSADGLHSQSVRRFPLSGKTRT